MPLLNDLAQILARLAPRGWAALLQQHAGGLDITKPKSQLAAELQRQLTGIDRQHPGFEELSTGARRGIEPGAPARSVLFHALASPDVHPLTVGARTSVDYPTLEELEVVENYIFSLAPRKLSSFRNPVIAVFACQYRTRAHTAHGQHADLTFSRAGVARVGTEGERYDGPTRSFVPLPADGGRGFAVLPARYVAYIAEYGAAAPTHAIFRPVAGIDAQLTFVMPVHKLFAGGECLVAEDGRPISLPAFKFAGLHVNEKLARIHKRSADNPGRVPPLPGFDLSAPPFVRTSKSSKDLITLASIGSSVLVVPVPNDLVRVSTQTVNGKREPVRFKVPAGLTRNRFWTSLLISSTDNGRAAPEYANIRLEITQTAGGQWRRTNLNEIPDPPLAGQTSFDKKLAAGGYEAAHLVDSTCEGAITLKPSPVLKLEILPAFSLVTAVDYFPQVEQAAVIAWLEKTQGRPIGLSNPGIVFPQGGPQPLSDGRFRSDDTATSLQASNAMPNSELADPLDSSRRAFSVNEQANLTATAVVGFTSSGTSAGQHPNSAGVSSCLPDAASDFFAPGWDVSEYVINDRSNYVAFGLGSPFPEDSKLCAALNSFWPAVAPDASRTFGFQPPQNAASLRRRALFTSIPLLDGELGYHPQHPRVLGAEVASSTGWDGDQGPLPRAVS